MENLNKKTKNQLIEIISIERENHSQKEEELSQLKFKLWQEEVSIKEQRKEFQKNLQIAQLDLVSELKSIQNMLIPFSEDSMTHREKTYLSKKFDRILQSKIDEKIKSINIDMDIDSNLPF